MPISATGSFSFAGYDNCIGELFCNLKITGKSGLLLNKTLTDSTVLDAFGAGANHFSVIVDGVKRDRYIWSGDLAVSSAPTIYYATRYY